MSQAQKIANVKWAELAHSAKLARGLPALCRQAFAAREVYGDSGREIAGRLGIPERAGEELLIQAARVCAQVNELDARCLGRGPSSEEADVANCSRE